LLLAGDRRHARGARRRGRRTGSGRLLDEHRARRGGGRHHLARSLPGGRARLGDPCRVPTLLGSDEAWLQGAPMIAPAPVRPAIRPAAGRRIAPLRWLGRAWRELRKMRTAIILLALLALLAVIGTLLPQLPQNPRGVMGYVLRHPATAPWFARLGLFDIFSSWPFIITAVLMYTSIGPSLFIRVPAAWRRAMEPAQRNRGLWAEIASTVLHASFCILRIRGLDGKTAGTPGDVCVGGW